MTTQTSRRELLRGNLRRPDVLRPPGARPVGFQNACTGCGDCAEACSEAIIRSDGHGGVALDLSQRACSFCGDCARACPTGALSLEHVADWPWIASVASTCLSLNRIACRSCEDACETRAIRFRLESGGSARPMIDAADCTGCGACLPVCPAGAIALSRRNMAENTPEQETVQ